MRHNFMPVPEQKRLKHTYRVHVLIVILFFLALSGIIGCAALFPVYVQVQNEVQTIHTGVKKDTGTAAKVVAIQNELKEQKQLMSVLGQIAGTPLSINVQNIVALRNTVSINSILIDRTGTTSISAVIQGKAPTRESLVAFKKRIEDMRPGTKVELPSSDLTKKTDISYSLKITQ